jgi:glycosyltransferase involved in cell wall biosynthesis
MKIAHLTSAHPRFDIRIFHKQCRSLVRAGHEVMLVVADGQGAASVDGVSIVDVGAPSGRAARMLHATRRVLSAAIAQDADAYHLHDPELLPIGVLLKRRGKIVIFDSHEDYPKQLRGKHYLSPMLRSMASASVAAVERWACPRFDAIVAATPSIREKFDGFHRRVVEVNNYPMAEELLPDAASAAREPRTACYVGAIDVSRGIHEMLAAIARTAPGTRLLLAGRFVQQSLRAESVAQEGWSRVEELGIVGRAGVRNMLARSSAGLVTLHPRLNYVDSQPIKMFEYMAAGVPVVCSSFPLWRGIVEGHRCGICVDPMNPGEIAAAIDRLASSPGEVEEMGRRGREAVRERFNWAVEEAKLLDLYRGI